MKILKRIELGLFIFLISGCAITIATKPEKVNFTYHEVRKGETLFRISKYYYEGETVEKIKQGIEKIMKANNLKNENISVGQRLLIPETNKQQPSYALLPPADIKPQSFVETKTLEIETKIVKESMFIWPVYGKIICKFGELENKGIDLIVEPATDVVASQDGEVVFAGNTKKYDETIIIKHNPSIYTVYAHDLEIKVKNGDRVKKGETIGKVKSGTQRKRYIHFEIIIDGVNVDPLKYLPTPEWKINF
ncbi:MAG: peptidoglycan DD-metalloendopeptidase family protein [Candidatus Omnitrophica bacterium]|nr:peptidoglycan DD-metalloendopeptidase family protein [Candidatus Omnitrophota bacterium]MCM8801796.1 peptidoglycan DD-metalloendopeptidase family protein [Candidatus Omnitrophota bacterium]